METIGVESFDMDIGRRVFIMIFFLLSLWFVLNYLATQIKQGKLSIPQFLQKKIPGLQNISPENADLYSIDIVQRKIMPDGSEMLVVNVDGRHILCSKTLQGGLNFICDLNQDRALSEEILN